MANFATTNSTSTGAGNAAQAMTTTYKTVIAVYNSSLAGQTNTGGFRRGKLYDLLVGTQTTPGDTVVLFRVARGSIAGPVSGSISSLSSNYAEDLADNTGASNGISINATAETSITPTTEIWMVGINQRASYRWVAAPGSEMVWPANSSTTGNNGLLVQGQGPSGGGSFTGTVTNTALWQEQ